MYYPGYGRLETADIRWNMIRFHITRDQLAKVSGIPEKKILDILSLKYVPDQYGSDLMDAIIQIKKKGKKIR